MVNSSRAEKRTSGSRDRSAPGFLATLAKRSSNGSSELRILWSWLTDLHLESPSADGMATCESGLEFPTSVLLVHWSLDSTTHALERKRLSANGFRTTAPSLRHAWRICRFLRWCVDFA